MVSGAPRFAPSSLNCTLWTPTSSDAVAATDATPETVEPAAGAVSDTVGAVVSASAVPLACAGRRGVAGRVRGHDDVVVGAGRQPGVRVGGGGATDGRHPVGGARREPRRGRAVHPVLDHADVVGRRRPVQPHTAELAGRREVRRERSGGVDVPASRTGTWTIDADRRHALVVDHEHHVPAGRGDVPVGGGVHRQRAAVPR